MRISIILRYIGLTTLLNSVLMAVSAIVSMLNNMDTAFYPLLLSTILTTIIGIFPLIFVSSDNNLGSKEGFVIVASSWCTTSLVGMLPYILWGGEFSLINSWFESVSGFTTTGSTILQDVEALPKGLLFWRSCTHLIGGAGIVIFALAILPSVGRARVSLSNVEMSSLAKESYSNRIDKIIKIIISVYVGLIAAETICLKVVGMSWFDAVNHAMSTIATGGFSTKNLSVAYYNNVWIELIIGLFMIFSGIHFGLIFSTIKGKKNNIFTSEASRYYLITIIAGSILVTINLWLTNTYDFLSSLRYAYFQFISIITTTGFATVDTAIWPSMSVMILIFYSIHCACSGSTTGGIKSDRFLILLKTFKARILLQQHPNAVIRVRMNGANIADGTVNNVLIFVLLYIIMTVLCTLMLTMMNIDLMTAFSAIVASIGNVGPGFNEVSSLSNYAGLPDGAKFVCSLAMLAGRLEIMGFIQLFLIKSWR